jgi:hypothetical protein
MVGPVEIGGAVNEIYSGFFRHGRIVTAALSIGNCSVNNSIL